MSPVVAVISFFLLAVLSVGAGKLSDLVSDASMPPPSQPNQDPSSPMPPPGYPTGAAVPPPSPPYPPPAYPPYQPPQYPPSQLPFRSSSQPTHGSVGALWLWGAVFGLCFAVVRSLIGFVIVGAVLRGAPPSVDATLQVIRALDFVNVAVCVAIAAFLAGMVSKRFASGVIAGVLLVIVSTGLSFLISMVMVAGELPLRTVIKLAVDTLLALPLPLLVGAGVGAAAGAVGALRGRGTARSAVTAPAPRS